MVVSERGVQIGYLTAERCAWIGAMIGDGREVRAIFQQSTKAGAIIRVTLDGTDPQLPEPSVESDKASGNDFHPDEIYPDD